MFNLTRRFTRVPTVSTSTVNHQQQQQLQQALFLLFASAAPTTTTSFRHQSSASDVEITDVANCFTIANSNRIPLGKVIHSVTPHTKSKIFKSGKGLEGYLKQFPSAFAVEKVGNDKFLLLVDERLRRGAGNAEREGGSDGDNNNNNNNSNNNGENISNNDAEGKKNGSAATTVDISSIGVKVIRPPPRQRSERDLERDRYLQEKSERRESEKFERQQQQQQQKQKRSESSATGGGDGAAAGGGGGSQMWVDEILQQEKDAKQKAAAASEQESSSLGGGSSGGDQQQQQVDAGDANPELTSRVKGCIPGENQWYKVQAIHGSLYKGTAVQLSPFVQFLLNAPRHFWVDAKNGFVCRRLPYHTQAPPNLQIKHSQTGAKLNPNLSHEWGEVKNAPTSQDIYEILRYIPIHWTEFGSIQIPEAARKKHIRVSSKLTWFARQPKFFDLRWIGGTIEIRRAPVLHPTEHGMTKEEAEKLVQHRIEEDAKFGQPLVLLQARGVQAASTPSTSSLSASTSSSPSSYLSASTAATPKSSSSSSSTTTQTTTPSSASASSASNASVSSSSVDAVTKALVRIAPGYFVAAEAIMRRATKRMTDSDLALAVERVPLMVERLVVKSKVNPKHSLSLYRRKLGLEDSKWKPELIKELEESPNLKLLGALMTHTCAQWDRTHFLYVRLPDVDKVESGGFDEMVNFLRLHPQCFRVGEYFVKRNDLSDPVGADADPEPTSKVVLNTKQLEDNPYHQLIDLANVFHYLIPEGESVSLSHFVDSSSPAMRSVLPPRILTILQAYPEKFNCREIAPGTYTVSRARNSSSAAVASATRTTTTSSGDSGYASSAPASFSSSLQQQHQSGHRMNTNDGVNSAESSAAQQQIYEDGEDDDEVSIVDDQEARQVATMTKEEAVEKLIAIVPARGVDIAHIEATMPQTLRRAIVRLFGAGGVAGLVTEHLDRFHVVKNPPYQTIFVRQRKQ